MSISSEGHTAPQGGGRVYRFSVDGKQYQTQDPSLTGAQIKARAAVDPSYALHLEGHGNDPDVLVADSDSVDFRLPGKERFYTSPPATFGV